MKATTKSKMKATKAKSNESRWFLAKITSLSVLKVLDSIRDRLSPTQLKLFRETCFGYFLDLENLNFSGQIVHSILLNKTDDEGDNIVCKIGTETITFGPREFTLITGLNFNQIPSDEDKYYVEKNKIRRLFFEDSEKINLYELEEVFNTITEKGDTKEGDTRRDKDIVRLSLIYFLEWILLGKEKRYYIDNNYLLLVEDLDIFNKWPWGRLSYQCLMSNIHTVISSTGKNVAEATKNHVGHYQLHGFPIALQIWGYEAIQAMGKSFGMRRSTTKLPRLLQWASKKPPKFEDCQSIIRRKEVACLNLKPSEIEASASYFLSIDQVINFDNLEAANEDDHPFTSPHEVLNEDENIEAENGDDHHSPSLPYQPRQPPKSQEITTPTTSKEPRKKSRAVEVLMAIHEDVKRMEVRQQSMEERQQRMEERQQRVLSLLKHNIESKIVGISEEGSVNCNILLVSP